MEHLGFALLKTQFGEVCGELERKGGIGLGILERMLVLMLPLVCDDLGCTRMDLRAIRNRIFPEAGVWLFVLQRAIVRLK